MKTTEIRHSMKKFAGKISKLESDLRQLQSELDKKKREKTQEKLTQSLKEMKVFAKTIDMI